MESLDSFQIGDYVKLDVPKHPTYDGRIGTIKELVSVGKWKVELDDGELVKVPNHKMQKIDRVIISPVIQYFLKRGAREWMSKHLQNFHGVETTSGSNKENHSGSGNSGVHTHQRRQQEEKEQQRDRARASELRARRVVAR